MMKKKGTLTALIFIVIIYTASSQFNIGMNLFTHTSDILKDNGFGLSSEVVNHKKLSAILSLQYNELTHPEVAEYTISTLMNVAFDYSLLNNRFTPFFSIGSGIYTPRSVNNISTNKPFIEYDLFEFVEPYFFIGTGMRVNLPDFLVRLHVNYNAVFSEIDKYIIERGIGRANFGLTVVYKFTVPEQEARK